MNTLVKQNDYSLEACWQAIANPSPTATAKAFADFERHTHRRRSVSNCCSSEIRACQLVQFSLPPGWDLDKCIRHSLDLPRLSPGLEDWSYDPRIRPFNPPPYFQALPPEHRDLSRSPWTQYAVPNRGLGLNARYLRYHHELWNELRPRTLRGVVTTLVTVTPQFSISFSPHIDLRKAFHFFGALSRAAGPCQLFPARYLYPDARLGGMSRMPAAQFGDVLPNLGGNALPVLDCEPNEFGAIARLGWFDRYCGYPVNSVHDPEKAVVLNQGINAGTRLPNGRPISASTVRAEVHPTLHPELLQTLQMDYNDYRLHNPLHRGIVTHDGLPFTLPTEMQTAVYAITTTAWELEMRRPGDLSEFDLKTKHAAIPAVNFYQQREPWHSNFMEFIRSITSHRDFACYPLTNHLTAHWLGHTNVCTANRLSEGESRHGWKIMANYYRQQLDWQMGVMNLANSLKTRRRCNPESELPFDGVAFHQMQPLLRFDSHYFNRPSRPASFFPDIHPAFLRFDQTYEPMNFK